MDSNNEISPENLVSNNYFQPKGNLDSDRSNVNLERSMKRKERESQVNIACSHFPSTDQCHVEDISIEELEEFHDRYWNCPGSLNKRIFMATYMAVDPSNSDRKNIHITCYCPRNDGTFEILCQKSFLSILGVSRRKLTGIGNAKLMNGEYLYKEKRGGNRRRPSTDDMNIYDNGINYSNENSQNHSNSINENESTIGSNLSENGGIHVNKKLSYLNDEDNGESNKSSESNNRALSLKRNKSIHNMDKNIEDDNAIFEPHIKTNRTHPSYKIEADTEGVLHDDIFQPLVELAERPYDENDEDNPYSVPNAKRPKPNSSISLSREYRNSEVQSSHLIKKESVYETDEERMAAREKARAILQNFHSQASMSRNRKPPQTNQPHQPITNHPNQRHPNHPHQPNWPSRNFSPNFAGHRNFPSLSYMGPENWQRTLERNIRRRQRMQEVKINCSHNLTRFCKVITVPQEDLVNFHNMYWNCQGIVEERIFLSKFMVVTPCNHRREMAIATRIPTSDGQLVEVCQKSFLSVVGITKHKVQAVARAKLKGTLFRKDGRGGFQKPRPQIEHASINRNNIQISNVRGQYENKEIKQLAFKQNETIEIGDSSGDGIRDNEHPSNRNQNFNDSRIIDEFDENDSEILSAEDAFANGKLNYEEFRKSIERNRARELFQAKINQLNIIINIYKRRNKKLMFDRKNYLVKLTKFNMENIKLKKKRNKFKQNANKIRLDNKSKIKEENILNESKLNICENQNDIEKTDSDELIKNLNLNNIEKSKDHDLDAEIFNEINCMNENDDNNILNNISDIQNFTMNSNDIINDIVEDNDKIQNMNS